MDADTPACSSIATVVYLSVVALRLRWYRRTFTRYGTSNKCGMGKTSYFRAKCVNITREMALTAAALLETSRYPVCNLFHVELEQFSACFCVAWVCQRQLGFLLKLRVHGLLF